MLTSAPGSAQQITIRANLEPARRLLALACSNKPVDEAAMRADPLLLTQIAHQAKFGTQFSMDNYIAGLRSIARCDVPSPDPFRMAALVKQRPIMTHAIDLLSSKQEEIGRLAADRIRPYVPANFSFSGSFVPLAASFSCGGFARDGAFFIDIPCVAEDIDGDYDAIIRLVAHETFHRIQDQIRGDDAEPGYKTADEAQRFLLFNLLNEGTASLVGDAGAAKGDGPFAKLGRDIVSRNRAHLEDDYLLLDLMIEAAAAKPAQAEARLPGIYGLAFGGRFGEHGYTVGQQMGAEIAHSFGAKTIPCLLAEPPEQYVLVYDRALADGKNLAESHAFSPDTIATAKRLAGGKASACLLGK